MCVGESRTIARLEAAALVEGNLLLSARQGRGGIFLFSRCRKTCSIVLLCVSAKAGQSPGRMQLLWLRKTFCFLLGREGEVFPLFQVWKNVFDSIALCVGESRTIVPAAAALVERYLPILPDKATARQAETFRAKCCE